MTAKGRDIYLKETATRRRNRETREKLQEKGIKLWRPVQLPLSAQLNEKKYEST